MDSIDSHIKIDETTKSLIVSGVSEDQLSIDYTDDVDFTELVIALTKCVDKEVEINCITPDEIQDDKLNIIISTIEDIYEKYNQAISEEIKDEDESSDVIEINEVDKNDLPF
ncbi:hypothetical protein [Halalkalibaculum sp. DA384]|uniref:hypothetical protein n=1 Tax=Halalkalibaculum sp. DA384 TaxID=3373606 RepID=UPI003754B79B